MLRPNGPEAWVKNAERIANELSYEDKEVVVYDEAVSSFQGPWAAESNARNNAIDKHLKDDHTHVFWIDTDIVEFDKDIIQKLLSLTDQHVVAPYVFIEENETWPFKRFYDISCFVDLDGKCFDYKQPYNSLPDEDLQSVSSVGTCFLMPADIYREHQFGGIGVGEPLVAGPGLRYDPYHQKNEHIPFFEKARKIGYKIYVTPKVEIRHAFLPKYGIDFR